MKTRADVPLTEQERFPLLTRAGRNLMKHIEELPCAPKFTFPCGDRLDRRGLNRVRAFARKLDRPLPFDPDNPETGWPGTLARHCYADVPFFRRRGAVPVGFFDIPPISREDLRVEPWAFVPDSQPLEDLIVYYTSGTTGTKTHVLSHPVVSSMYLALLEKALAQRGIPLRRGADGVALMQVCSQKTVFTHVTVSSFLRGAGYVKINLNPAEWRRPDDIVTFFDKVQPQIVTGDPVSLNELGLLPVAWKPAALVSSAMTLHPGARSKLEKRFGCPLLDVYSLNECRFVACRWDDGPFEVIAPDLFPEVLGAPSPGPGPAGVGEIVLTCDRNPFFPLLRYRTGDSGRLERRGNTLLIHDLVGRPPVLFRTPDGRFINNIDIVQILRPFPLFRYHLHQNRDGGLILEVSGLGLDHGEIGEGFRQVFGAGVDLTITPFAEGVRGEKQLEFTSDLPQDLPDRTLDYLSDLKSR